MKKSSITDLASLWGAHLFVPACNAGYLTSLPLLGCKNIIIDLEYATPLPQKNSARFLCHNAIRYIREMQGKHEINIAVRVNIPKLREWVIEDLRIVMQAGPNSIRIPCVNSVEDILFVEEQVTHFENTYQLDTSVWLHPMIETPQGLRYAYEIASATSRNQALCFGGEDWAQNLGLTRTQPGAELEFAKAQIVSAAIAAELFPIDTVHNWLNDEVSLQADTERSKIFGYRARATINPRQIQTINEIYWPNEEEVEKAHQKLEALEEIMIDNESCLVVNGVISDPLAIAQARMITDFARNRL
jgi:citrate lyase subunit beta/citryl-CoA lyase